jgi:hypothetical protein
MKRYTRFTEDFEILNTHIHELGDKHRGALELTQTEFNDDDIIIQRLLSNGHIKATPAEVSLERSDNNEEILIKDAETDEIVYTAEVKLREARANL